MAHVGKEGILIEEHSVKDLFAKLDLIHAQTTKTNGRVTALEAQSMGRWVSKHPLTFAAYLLLFFAIVISDSRHVLLKFLFAWV